MSDPIRVLHVLGRLDIGGAESRIMDLYRAIDRELVQFDFMIHTTDHCYFEDEINSLGGRIYHVPRFKVLNYFEYKKAWKEFFKEHREFQAVHGHMTSTGSIYQPIAKKAGVPITIAHARSAGTDPGLKGLLTKWMRRSLSGKVDYCFACSTIAGEAVFGQKAVEENKIILFPNAIPTEMYLFDPHKREEMREKLGICDRYVIGHVGRFHYAKNHEFLLEVFTELKKRQEKAVLLLVGDGPLLGSVKEKAKELGIEEDVIYTGNQSNVNDYYQAMDYLVFPSRYEGLPGTIVEAQVSGLKCLVSDAVTREVAMTELVTYFSLEKSPKEWATMVMEQKDNERRDFREEVQAAGYDVKEQARKITDFYMRREKNGSDC
ncbi:MAG: glycosyltransferase family 1 protein [Lachnospiraceae bacterium]|nr:glycosyltransferase family 1 protein [Lachnospiraceae bacterium]